MENLSGKVDNIDNLPAGQWNQPATEQNNIIIQTGQTPVNTDLDQLGKGVAEYVANGNFYLDSGVVNAFILTSIGGKQSVQRYVDGMEVSFIAGTTNTGASTVNIAGLGVRNIINVGTGSEIQVGSRVDIVYRLATDDFQFLRARGTVESVYPVTTGTATVYTAVLGINSYAVNGSYRLRAHIPNSGPATIQFDGLPVITILTSEGQPLASGQFIDIVELFYNGTNFILAYSGQVSIGDVSGLGALAAKNTVASGDIDNGAVVTAKVPDGNITEVKLSAAVQTKLVPGGANHTQPATSISGLGSLATLNTVAPVNINWPASSGIAQGLIKEGGVNSAPGYSTFATTKIKIPSGVTSIEYYVYQRGGITGAGGSRLATTTQNGTGLPPTATTDVWDGPGLLTVSDKNGWIDVFVQIAGASSPANIVTLSQVVWSFV